MARKKSGALVGLLVAALALALLAALNPTQADFKSYLAGQATKGIKPGLLSGLAQGAGALSSGLFTRQDYIFASTYSLSNKEGSVYLGMAKLFIKLR